VEEPSWGNKGKREDILKEWKHWSKELRIVSGEKTLTIWCHFVECKEPVKNSRTWSTNRLFLVSFRVTCRVGRMQARGQQTRSLRVWSHSQRRTPSPRRWLNTHGIAGLYRGGSSGWRQVHLLPTFSPRTHPATGRQNTQPLQRRCWSKCPICPLCKGRGERDRHEHSTRAHPL
jgi:hypothetical protein